MIGVMRWIIIFNKKNYKSNKFYSVCKKNFSVLLNMEQNIRMNHLYFEYYKNYKTIKCSIILEVKELKRLILFFIRKF